MTIKSTSAPVDLFELVDDAASLRPSAYLLANPDVKAAGVDALSHWIAYGKAEGRRQITDGRRIAELRAEKLARVRFRGTPQRPAATGEPVDYLPDDIRESFKIPKVVPISDNEYDQESIQIIFNNPDMLMLDIGAGLRHTYYPNVVNTEIWSSPSTDVVCVGEDLPFADNQFDHIFCIAVLEHTKRPWEVCKEIVRVLKPGGNARIDWPFLQPLHGFPHHYFNATSVGAISQFEDSCDILSAETKPWQHPVFALSWLLLEWNAGLPVEMRHDFSKMTIGDFLIPSAAPLVNSPFCQELSADVQNIISAGTTFTCRKR